MKVKRFVKYEELSKELQKELTALCDKIGKPWLTDNENVFVN